MYSVVVEGKVLDFRYKKHGDNSYLFYIGDVLIGTVFKMKRYWTAVSWEPKGVCPVDGLRTGTMLLISY